MEIFIDNVNHDQYYFLQKVPYANEHGIRLLIMAVENRIIQKHEALVDYGCEDCDSWVKAIGAILDVLFQAVQVLQNSKKRIRSVQKTSIKIPF